MPATHPYSVPPATPWHCCFCGLPVPTTNGMMMHGPGTDHWLVMAANHERDPGSFQIAHSECLWQRTGGMADYWYPADSVGGAPERVKQAVA